MREETPPSLLASATTEEALLRERFVREGIERLVNPEIGLGREGIEGLVNLEIRRGGPVMVPPVRRDIVRLEKQREPLRASLARNVGEK